MANCKIELCVDFLSVYTIVEIRDFLITRCSTAKPRANGVRGQFLLALEAPNGSLVAKRSERIHSYGSESWD
jgi:hypothetical protein